MQATLSISRGPAPPRRANACMQQLLEMGATALAVAFREAPRSREGRKALLDCTVLLMRTFMGFTSRFDAANLLRADWAEEFARMREAEAGAGSDSSPAQPALEADAVQILRERIIETSGLGPARYDQAAASSSVAQALPERAAVAAS